MRKFGATNKPPQNHYAHTIPQNHNMNEPYPIISVNAQSHTGNPFNNGPPQPPPHQPHHNNASNNADSKPRMNTQVHTKVFMYNFKINHPLNIYFKDADSEKLLYLSCNSANSEVHFSENDDGNGQQKWIIEQDPDDVNIYYIKTLYYHPINNIRYLGCPNQSGLVYLYTSKNRYSKWNIKPVDKFSYQIIYAGEKFDKACVSLIVARYAEDITWTNAYSDIAIIYNKGVDNIPDVLSQKVPLENVGREGHTYLHHIIENYDNLASQLIFTQADPFVHNPTILCGIDNHFALNDVQALGLYYLKKLNLPPVHFTEDRKTITQYGLEYLIVESNANLICPDFVDQGMLDLRVNADNDYKGVRFQSKPITEGFLNRAIFPITNPLETIKYSFSGLFSVNRDRVAFYPKIVYNGLIEELISKSSQGGVNGYILEKLWLYIFTNAN